MKKDSLRGWREVFTFTVTQTVKSKSYRVSLAIMLLIILVSMPLMNIFLLDGVSAGPEQSVVEKVYVYNMTMYRNLDMEEELAEGYRHIVFEETSEPMENVQTRICEEETNAVILMLAEDEEFSGKVFVVDNGRIATPLHRSILDAMELVEEGCSAAEIKEILEADKENMTIYIAVETLEFLKKGGRITATTAAIGTLLNIKPVLRLGVGVLDTYKKCRGMRKAKNEMLETMKQEMEGKYKEAIEKKEFYLMAASSADEETTKEWVEEIKAYFPGFEVLCDNLSMGISCHTGDGALGIGCSCKPKRNPKN